MDDQITTTKDEVAQRIRDWIHGQPLLSLCSMSCDTCPDWELANELAEVALELPRKVRPALQLPSPPPKKRQRWPWTTDFIG